MTPLLVKEIEIHLAADAVDMTPVIQSVVGYDNETIAPMSRWDFNIASHPVIDRKMIGRLKAIFSHYADRNFLVSRGLSAEDAIAKIRKLRPGSVETAAQEERVAEFADREAKNR